MELHLSAGIPNDANRQYVPMDIPGTKMTVNENGNNSQVYPSRLREQRAVLADGLEDVWFEYVPESYDGTKKVPLIISNHGGLMNGWAQAIYSSWTLLAEREGFICVFPNSHSMNMWTIQGMSARKEKSPDLVLPVPMDPEDYRDNHDMNFLKALILHMQNKYCIDAGRVFMHGMSMGHVMTDQFARYYAGMLTAVAGSGGCASADQLYDENGSLVNIGGPIPIWFSHPERNGMPGSVDEEKSAQWAARDYWFKVNGITSSPRISIQGEHNLAFYSGRKGDFVYLDIKNRDHGQALDEAFLYWNYLFSGLRRQPDGTILCGKTNWDRSGDRFSLAVIPGSANAWVSNQIVKMSAPAVQWQKLKYHGLNGGQMIRGKYLCVSLRFLADVFEAEYKANCQHTEVTLTLKDGRMVQFARGVIGCILEDNLYSMYCEAIHRNGELMVSVEWFCRFLFNLQVSVCEDVVYVTDHFAELSAFMADIIREELNKECVRTELI